MVEDFISHFDTHFAPKLGQRATTFRAVLREAALLRPYTIVETGCLRSEGNWQGDGQSSIIWNQLVRSFGGRCESYDIDEEAVVLTNRLCPYVVASICDSVTALSKINIPIDLLYLDSFDIDMGHQHPAALHCMFEFCAAKRNLHTGSIVFIDDSPITDDGTVIGKGLYVAQHLKHLGILPFATGYQAAWVMP